MSTREAAKGFPLLPAHRAPRFLEEGKQEKQGGITKRGPRGTGHGSSDGDGLMKRPWQHRQLTGKAPGTSQIGFVMSN